MTGWLDVHAHYVTPHYRYACLYTGHEHPDGLPRIADWSRDEALDVMGRTGVEPQRLPYGRNFPFTPAPPLVGLAAALAQAPALRSADLTLATGSATAALLPRLRVAQDRPSHEI